VEDHIEKALGRAAAGNPRMRKWTRPEPYGQHRKPTSDRDNPPLANDPNLGKKIALDLDHMAKNFILAGRDHEDAIVADRYRLLRTRIRQLMKPREWTKLGITSPAAKDGKSLTALNLAITAARDTSGNVVLMDCDFRRPSLISYTGIETGNSLADYLNGEAEIADIIYRPTAFPNLYLIPTELPDITDRILEGRQIARLQELLNYLESSDTLLFVDLPPVLIGDDVLALAPMLDALLLVLRDDQTSTDDIRQATDLVSNFNVLGSVLNCSTSESNSMNNYYHAKEAN